MNPVAIDPMALILHGEAYLRWVEMRHPHVPALKTLQEVLKTASPVERNGILKRAKALAAMANAVDEAMPASKAEIAKA